jgi:predicted dinucleotide-binding enzyme
VSEVTVVVGAGSIGQAIARRVSAGKHVLLADLHQPNADAAAKAMGDAGFQVSTATVDVSSRESLHGLVETATGLGEVTGVIHAAGVSPSQASPAVILAVDLYGTAVLLEEFGNVIARGGAGVVISSQSGHRLGALTADQDAALATTPAEELLSLPMLGPDQVTDSLQAYQLAKRGNSLRVMAEAVRWASAARGSTRSARASSSPPRHRRADRPSRCGLPALARVVPGGAGRHPGRGRDRRCAPYGPRRRVHHRQRRAHGRWRHRRLVLRRPRPTVIDQAGSRHVLACAGATGPRRCA